MNEIPLVQSSSEKTILVVDDEQTLRDTLKYNLSREGYRVLTAPDGMEALRLVEAESIDLMILDIMMPGLTGIDVCRTLRKKSTLPVLMLSAREDEIDKVLALEIGADDYLTKPFGLRELLSRVRALLRRVEMPSTRPVEAVGAGKPILATSVGVAPAIEGSAPTTRSRLVAGELTIDLMARSTYLSDRPVTLMPKEFDLLAFLAAHPGRVFSRDALLERVWGYDFVGGKRTVDSHISSLRRKLEKDPSSPQFIQTMFGVGYKFNQLVAAR